MPFNPNELFSDACTSYGMAGILRFGPSRRREHDVDGLFWQYSWVEWTKIVCMLRLMPGAVQINVAEFLAALITCETFAPYCRATCTLLSVDSKAAKYWIDNARCSIYPFDRCAQGTHLLLLKESIKIRSRWIASDSNAPADVCSRRRITMKCPRHFIAGLWLRKVRPKYTNVLKYLPKNSATKHAIMQK